MTGFVLVFGFLFILSCSTFSTSTDTAGSLFESENYSAALRAVEEEIRENPNDDSAKFLKARILKSYAVEQHEPENRETVYLNLRNTAEQINQTSVRNKSRTDSLLTSAWKYEQSAGIRLLQQDNTETFDQYFTKIVAHFNNAIAVIPDSSVTYNLKATTYYRHGDLSGAIESLEQYTNEGFTRPPDMCEKLAYLYLEAGQIDRSISIYESLAENNPDSEVYQQGLVNSYILGEKHKKSVDLLELLTERYPNRAQYRESLATEQFYLFEDNIEQMIEDSGVDQFTSEEIRPLINRLNQISDTYEDVNKILPISQERQQRIGTYYLRSANTLKKLMPLSGNESNELLTNKVEDLLNASIPYWQKLYEANPDVTVYARRLIYVYNEIGMEQEAELLEQQINI